MSQIKLTADSGGGTTSLKAPSSTTSNADVVLKLPVADGSANQVLKTDGSGQLSFTSNAGTTINNNADNRIITGSGTASTLNGESTLTYDGDTLLSTNTNFVIKSIDTNASNAENYIQFNAGYITYDSDASNSTGYSGHYFQVDGSEKLRINNSGQLVFDADTNTYLARPAADTLAFTTGGTERLRIDSSGRVGIGTNNPSNLLHCATPNTTVAIFESTASGGTGAELLLHHNSSSPADGDNIGAIYFQADDDAGNKSTFGNILVNAEDVSNGSEDAHMRFETATNGTLSEKMRILSGGGITFNGDTSSANALDDYEEGTWTPTLNSGNSLSFSSGRYVKIGAMVYAFWEITMPTNSQSAHMIINNTPFTSINHNASCGGTAKDYQQYDIENGPIYHVPKAHTQVQFYKNSGQNFSESNGSGLNFRGCTIYQTET